MSKGKVFIFSNKAETVKEALVKSSVINIIAKGFGYFKNLSIAYLLGFSYQTDAIFMALSLLGIFLIFADVFDSIGIPNLVKARMENEKEFYKLSGLLFTFTITLSLAISLIAFISYPIIKHIPFGFKEETLKFLKDAYFLLIPYLVFYFLFHHFGAVLRSIRRFTQFFIGEFVFSFFCFLFITIGLIYWKDYRVIPISISLSQFLAAIYMLIVSKKFIHLKLYYDKTVFLMLKHFIYLSALYGVFHLFILVDKAFSSTLGEKAISALTYGLMLASIPRSVLRVEHMAITSLSEAENLMEKLKFYTKKIFQLSLPMAVFLFLTSYFWVKILFHYGAFTEEDVRLTALAGSFFSLSLPFFFWWPILYRTFQILNWLKPVFFIAIGGVLGNLAFNYLLVMVFKLGIQGICLATFFKLCFIMYVKLLDFKVKRR
ncbi:lipid II flippase MurJ [Caldisericum sp.]|jgi:putative peptidoglycan lipid II flippase|uniref:lipid II flippase MurJ n=1 Tax=Caldisericum sp. TaxID=2499687 RepID=UPI003D12033D